MSDDAIQKARELVQSGVDVVVVTIMKVEGSAPRHEGSAMTLTRDGRQWGTVGGGKVEAESTKAAQRAFETKERSRICHFGLRMAGKDAIGTACGGDVDVKVEYFEAGTDVSEMPEPRRSVAYLFGGGHVNQALELVLRTVGFDTVVVDHRPEFANTERFPQARRTIVCDSYEDAAMSLPPDPNGYIIIATSGHVGDLDALRGVVGRDFAYIGMIGSKRKIAFIYNELRKSGVSDEQLDAVYAPIGEPILAETPEEIAISITAQVIKIRAELARK